MLLFTTPLSRDVLYFAIPGAVWPLEFSSSSLNLRVKYVLFLPLFCLAMVFEISSFRFLGAGWVCGWALYGVSSVLSVWAWALEAAECVLERFQFLLFQECGEKFTYPEGADWACVLALVWLLTADGVDTGRCMALVLEMLCWAFCWMWFK
jgi:hypothetical protein